VRMRRLIERVPHSVCDPAVRELHLMRGYRQDCTGPPGL
jgi:hypothetical protein